MQTRYNVYPNLGYWFGLLLVLALAGFYTSYLSVIFQPTVPLIHSLFILLTLWIAMLIAQPFLIKAKKLALHRSLGKLSYGLVPLVFLSSFLMIRFSYYRDLDQFHQEAARGLNPLTPEQILQQVAQFKALPFVWLSWFIVFYCLGISYRHQSSSHARFMLATALALLGPIVDRILFKLEKAGEYIRLESGAFLLADGVIALLLWTDYKMNRSTKPLGLALLIYVLGQVLYFTLPGSPGWTSLVTFLMKPEP
jgi:hypothetical protein